MDFVNGFHELEGGSAGRSPIGANTTFQTIEAEQAGAVSHLSALNPPQECSVHNFYGQGVPISSDIVRTIGVSVESKHFPDNAKERKTWEEIKRTRHPAMMTVDILGTAPDGSELTPIRGSLNLGTGELAVSGVSKGVLPQHPADYITSALDKEGSRAKLPDTVEEAVWEYVKGNLDKFEWRKK